MIRLKVFIPFVLIVALVAFVIVFKIDGWLTNWIEGGISAITDTKTDITNLKLSFKESSLRIKRLEIASSEDDMKNAVEFGDIIIDFQSLPVLQKRFVIDNFSIKDVAWGTRRLKSGKLPPQKKEPPSWFSERMSVAMNALKKEGQDLPVSKLLDFEVPTDPHEIVNALKLQSDEAFKAAITKAEQIKGDWKVKIQALKDVSAYEVKIADARKLLANPPQNPQEILQSAESVKSIYDFFQAEKRRAESLLGDVTSDTRKIQAEMDNAKKALESDFERAKKMVSLDSLNVNNLSKMIFGPIWIERVETILRYHSLLRTQLASKSAQDDAVEVKKRAKGRDIIFVRPNALPSFVMAKSEFSVNNIEGGDRKSIGQAFKLKLDDINSAPKLYGKPSRAEFDASFKEAILENIMFKAFWDYTKDVAKDEFSLSAQHLKASEWPIGIPKVFPVKLGSGFADADTKLSFEGDMMKWVSKISFQSVVWDFSEMPSGGLVYSILRDVMSNVKNFHLEVELKSEKEGLQFAVRSDLDEPLKAGVNAAIQKKLGEFQERVRQAVLTKVSAYQDQATKQMADFQSGVGKQVEGFLGKVTGYSDEANRIQDSLKKKAQGAATQKAKEQIQKAIPGLGNPLKGIKTPF